MAAVRGKDVVVIGCATAQTCQFFSDRLRIGISIRRVKMTLMSAICTQRLPYGPNLNRCSNLPYVNQIISVFVGVSIRYKNLCTLMEYPDLLFLNHFFRAAVSSLYR